MLEQLARHSLIDIELEAKGDLHIDFHHTTEDTGIVLGQAVAEALGDRAGIQRYGDALISDGRDADPRGARRLQPALSHLEGRLHPPEARARWIPSCSANGFRPSPRPPG